MEEELKIMLFEILYNKLNLKEIEEYFTKNGVESKEFINDTNLPINSKYFWLLNNVLIENLEDKEKYTMYELYRQFKLGNFFAKRELYYFLEKNMLKLLIPKTEEPYFYWGPKSFQYIAPSDAITLAFHYVEFYEDEIEEERINDIVVDKINEFQESEFEDINATLAVVVYNEIFEFSKNSIKL